MTSIRFFKVEGKRRVMSGSISDAFGGTLVEYNDLRLRPIVYEDLDDMAVWPRFEEQELAWANFPAKTMELKKRWYVQQQKDHLQWIIIRNAQNELIARCSLTQPLSGSSVIYGLVVRPDYVGQGLGTQITKIMVSYIFKVAPFLSSIWLESRYDNVRAHRTWEKVGFVKIGEHMRREVFGRYDRYFGFILERKQLDELELPAITVVSV